LSRLLAPVFTRRYVAFCNAQALKRMEANYLNSNPAPEVEPRARVVGAEGVDVSTG
jgi:hypothetical protein